MEPLNNVDVIILIGVAISMLVAFIRGFVKEILSILGLALFIILTVYLSPLLTPLTDKYIASKLLSQFVIFLVIMAVFYAFWIIGTDKLIAKIRTSTLSFMDRLFGLLFGFLRAVLILGFCFLIVKIVMPEELEDKDSLLKKSQYFMMSESCSDVIEKMLPDDFIQNIVASVKEMDKVDAKQEKESEKNKKADDKEKQKEDEVKELPTKMDQEQMDKMFELLVKPEIDSSKKEKPEKQKNENSGYDSKEINSLDRLIDITAD